MWLVTPLKFFASRENVAIADYTKLECKMALDAKGWSQRRLGPEARVPLKAASEKVYYMDRHGNAFLKYLQCLLSADDLFAAGVVDIHHGQIEAYYDCILQMPDSGKGAVRPNLPARTYKAILLGDVEPSGSAAADILMIEDDGAPQRCLEHGDAASPAEAGPPVPPPVEVLRALPNEPGVVRQPPASGKDRAAREADPERPGKIRRGQPHPKSLKFGPCDIRYIESPPVHQYRAFCTRACHNQEGMGHCN